MSDKVVIVVGDRFEGFGATPGVHGFSRMVELLTAGEIAPPAIVVEGQGLHDDQRGELRARLDALGVRFRSVADPDPARADAGLTHKRVPANILVSVPAKIAESTYAADLLVDDRNEILSDHLTGRHVQGLMLIEAARQMWTAVTERYHLNGGEGRFVIEEVSSRFERFLFPLAARIVYTAVEVVPKAVETSFRGRCEFEQLGARTAVVEARFRVLRPALIAKHESMAAREAVRAVGAQVE
jgi:hypothetical protein